MRSYLVVLVLAITVYWFKDSVIDLTKDYLNDVDAQSNSDQSEPKTRKLWLKFLTFN